MAGYVHGLVFFIIDPLAWVTQIMVKCLDRDGEAIRLPGDQFQKMENYALNREPLYAFRLGYGAVET